MMFPTRRAAGLAGIAGGLGLAVEFGLFMASGWGPDIFGDPAAALQFLESGGQPLRLAAFVGFVNLGFTLLFLVGLAGALHRAAPTRAATLLYLGVVGVAAHALVPVGLWLGPPSFLDLAATDRAMAAGAWGGFAAFLDAAGGAGYLFNGVAVMAGGSAIVTSHRLPRAVGWVGLLGGGASALTVLGTETPVASLAAGLYMPALVLTILFRVWAGARLWRRVARPVEA